jgi:hypothetical protein
MENKFLWDARIVISFKACSLKLNILVLETTKEQAEGKAVEWAKKYVEDNYDTISKRIGHDAKMVREPRVQAFKTAYTSVI